MKNGDVYSLHVLFLNFLIMAQSDARFGYRAKLSRTDHDLSQPFGFTSAPGQIYIEDIPNYHIFQKDKVHHFPNVTVKP